MKLVYISNNGNIYAQKWHEWNVPKASGGSDINILKLVELSADEAILSLDELSVKYPYNERRNEKTVTDVRNSSDYN